MTMSKRKLDPKYVRSTDSGSHWISPNDLMKSELAKHKVQKAADAWRRLIDPLSDRNQEKD